VQQGSNYKIYFLRSGKVWCAARSWNYRESALAARGLWSLKCEKTCRPYQRAFRYGCSYGSVVTALYMYITVLTTITVEFNCVRDLIHRQLDMMDALVKYADQVEQPE
jgi:hypothetical protein